MRHIQRCPCRFGHSLSGPFVLAGALRPPPRPLHGAPLHGAAAAAVLRLCTVPPARCRRPLTCVRRCSSVEDAAKLPRRRRTWRAWLKAPCAVAGNAAAAALRPWPHAARNPTPKSHAAFKQPPTRKSSRSHSKAVVIEQDMPADVEHVIPVGVENGILHRCW